MKNIKIKVIVFCLVAVCAWYASKEFIVIKRAEESKSWLRVDGVILSSENVEYNERVRSGKYTHKNVNKIKKVIKYEYKIDGQVFTNGQIQIGYEGCKEKQSCYDKVNWLASKFYQGKHISVFYNPKDFNDSVLIQGVNSYFYYVKMIFWLVILICIVILNKKKVFENILKKDFLVEARKKAKGCQF